MKAIASIIILLFFVPNLFSQNSAENEAAIKRAALDYIEGFYEGDTLKIKNALKPSLYKFGYWKNKEGVYKSDGLMSYQDAINYAKSRFEKKKPVNPNWPKGVVVLDISNHIAAAKITAWWGVDYLLLSKDGNKWIIEQVLWKGPLDKKNITFKNYSNSPYVFVKVNDKGPYLFLLDMGTSGIGRIDSLFVQELKLPVMGSTQNSDGINTRNENLVGIKTLEFGAIKLEDFEIMTRNYNRGNRPFKIYGILVRGFFKNHILTINYPKST